MSPVNLVAQANGATTVYKPAPVKPKRTWVRKPKVHMTGYQEGFKVLFGSYPLVGDSLKKRPKNGVVAMTREAFQLRNALGTAIGMVFGGFVPAASYVVSHMELSGVVGAWGTPMAILVYGGLVYSARTVLKWAYMAFRDAFKACGFVIIVEGVMTFSRVPELSFFALGLLVLINAIAAGVTLSRG